MKTVCKGAYPLPVEDEYIPYRIGGDLPASWVAIRRRVYLRDGKRCHACGLIVEEKHYECGHVIDRCRGGSDDDFNLVTMCVSCNRMKPVHSTRSEYFEWLQEWRDFARNYVRAVCPYLFEEQAK